MRTVKYAYELVLLPKKGRVLKGMIDKISETGRFYGWKRIWKKLL
jgi:hypothetical protein